MGKRVVVEAPASSANLGCGFDVFALGLAEPWDSLSLQKTESKITVSVRGSKMIAAEPKRNVVGAVASAMMAEHGLREGVAMTLTKGVPVGAGLGSSAASSIAAAAGINRLFELGLPNREIVRCAGIGEKVASGTAHHDNVAASLAGGFVVVQKDYDFVKMEPPESMALCLVTPRLKLPTEKTKFARSLVPREVPIHRAVSVARAASMMVHGFAAGSLEEIGEAMNESLVDDRRSVMIPCFGLVKREAVTHGAAGVCISGAGPTLHPVTEKGRSQRVMKEMVMAFKGGGIESRGFVTEVGGGCRILKR